MEWIRTTIRGVVRFEPVAVSYLDALGVFLVERANVEGVGRVHLAPWRDEGRRVLLVVDLVPVDAREERVLLHLSSTTKQVQQGLIVMIIY